MVSSVYFIGAGPGSPDLLTLRARDIIARADVIIYADSLVNPQVCASAKQGAEIYGSASLALDEIIRIIEDAVRQDKTVARLHSGDPAIYGAVREQISALDEKGITCEIVPGVSSLFAAAAALKCELTVPGISQTVIITRVEGRTPVPELEDLKSLASHRSSMAIFLSAAHITRVVQSLIDGGYTEDTPSALVYRASWEDEKVIRSPLKDMPGLAAEAGINRHALIMVGPFLEHNSGGNHSQLYDREFKHGYRP